MQQRVNVCRSIVHAPRLVMLDEPFAALDAFTREALWAIMQRLWIERGFTAVLITHDLREAVYLADEVIVMSARPRPDRAPQPDRPPPSADSRNDLHRCFPGPRSRAARKDPDGAREHMNARTVERLMPWAVTIGFFMIWEACCRLFDIDVFILPAPSDIWVEGVRYAPQLGYHSLQTLYTTLAGFALAVVVGVALGAAIGSSRLVYRGLYPVLIGFNSVPKVALVPVLVIWFGIGTVPAILTAFVISFFPIAVNVATGLATIERDMTDVLRSLGATRRDILVKVGLPRSLPYLFASLKVAITLSFVGSVIAETVASNKGIGYLMLSASSNYNVPLVSPGCSCSPCSACSCTSPLPFWRCA